MLLLQLGGNVAVIMHLIAILLQRLDQTVSVKCELCHVLAVEAFDLHCFVVVFDLAEWRYGGAGGAGRQLLAVEIVLLSDLLAAKVHTVNFVSVQLT